MSKRILYVQASFVPPPKDPEMDRFYWLSQTFEGDVLQPVWFSHPAEIEAEFGPGSYPVYTRGNFRYHWFLAWRFQGVRQRLEILRFYLRCGLRLLRRGKFDCIVVYSHMATGVVGGLLKLLSGVKSVVEVVTAPNLVYLADKPNLGVRQRMLHFYSNLCLHVSLGFADRVHLLYPGALSPYGLLKRKPVSVFHEFVPVSRIPSRNGEAGADDYLLLVGAPWYAKGVDLLIAAFRNISPEFPAVKLKILGYVEDRAMLDALIAHHPQIEIMKPRPNPETLEVIAGARIMILPSRCEGMPRVLLEAMAAGVPVIASDVGGIRFLLADGQCGLIVPAGDAVDLERRLRDLLVSPELRRGLSEAAYRRAHCELNEKEYVDRFTAMVQTVS